MTLTFRRALLVTIGGTLLAALAVGGLTLDRRLAGELERDARAELAMAPPILADRLATQEEALRMHAGVLSENPELRRAFSRGDRNAGVRRAEATAAGWGERPILVPAAGERWTGPMPSRDLLAAVARDRIPVAVQYSDQELHAIAVAQVVDGDERLGIAGVALPLDTRIAEILSGLTRSDVVLVGPGGAMVASTLQPPLATAVSAGGGEPRLDESGKASTVEIATSEGRLWSVAASLGSAGTAYFVRFADRELAALPRLRKAALAAAGLALIVTLLVGSMVASRLARPLSELATASKGVASEDFEAPLPASRVREVETVSRAFAHMREALAARIGELRDANRALEDRQRRLQALQAEIIQRDRLVAAGRLVTELAHEIRNPVANVRNCLEVVRRRIDDAKAQEFTELAIAELLRMHELAEQMLDLNRPSDPAQKVCDVRTVVEEVATLATLSDRAERWPVRVEGPEGVQVAIPPDTLKRVLLTVLTNARDATPDGGAIDVKIYPSGGSARAMEDSKTDPAVDTGAPAPVVIEVADHGHGIPDDVLSYVFDPFFTTKEEVHGVGLGLFIAQGTLRRLGGQMSARNRSPGPGAAIRLELPLATAETLA